MTDTPRDKAIWSEAYHKGYETGYAKARATLDVERLRRAIYVVSVRHDWENRVDREDRTQEIADAYALVPPLLAGSDSDGISTPHGFRLSDEEPHDA